MDVGVYTYPLGDSMAIDRIVNEFLSQGKFDKLRKECMSDADTKPAYQNLQQRVENTVTQFLKKQVWRPDLNKNQLRDTLRKHILDSNFFDAGINRIVDQVVNPNVLATVFLPEVEEVVYNCLSIPRPTDKSHKRGGNDYARKETDIDIKPDLDSDRNLKNAKKEDYYGRLQTADIENANKFRDSDVSSEANKIGTPTEDFARCKEYVKVEVKSEGHEATATKDEPQSDESQESLSRMGVEKLHINDMDLANSIDSDDSAPLEINEKSISDSRDSEDSIMNQMSPISQGRLTPDSERDEKEGEVVDAAESKEEEKEEKKPLTFTGRITEIKREESESSKSAAKSEIPKLEKPESKHIYSSDESDSSKSFNKSDSDDRKSKEKKEEGKKSQRDDKSRRHDSTGKRRDCDRNKSWKDGDRDRDKDKRSRDERSKDRKRERSRERSRERGHGIKKGSSSSGSSSSRDKSSYKSSHESRHKDSKTKDNSRDRKRKEEYKKKSKSTDDHGKERNKKDDRRSTDRDSNERDRSSGGRSHGESRRREREQKTEESGRSKSRQEGAEMENEMEVMPGSQEVVIEMDGDWVSEEDEIVLVNGDWMCSGGVVEENEVNEAKEAGMMAVNGAEQRERTEEPDEEALDFSELVQSGALTRVAFPKLTDDFYVKFNSTGFKYFEEWEQCKLDCEDEFKSFVDEAENDLGLLSDDGSDPECEEQNWKTIGNLLRGLGNFKSCLMFDPLTTDFYQWTNSKFYQKFRKRRDWKWPTKNDSDESIKENIDRMKVNCEEYERQKEKNKENLAKERKALHLKLLNRFKRKAIWQGKHRRRPRRKALYEGIKEKNDNPNMAVNNLMGFQANNLLKPDIRGLNDAGGPQKGTNLVSSKYGFIEASGVDEKEPYEKAVKDVVADIGMFECKANLGPGNGQLTMLCGPPDVVSMLPDSPEDANNVDVQRRKKGFSGTNEKAKNYIQGKTENLKTFNIAQKCQLPLSPESDDCSTNNGIIVKVKNKRVLKVEENEVAGPRKQPRRNYCQKYESQDLYKPRPSLNGSRTRGRSERVAGCLEEEDSSVKK